MLKHVFYHQVISLVQKKLIDGTLVYNIVYVQEQSIKSVYVLHMFIIEV